MSDQLWETLAHPFLRKNIINTHMKWVLAHKILQIDRMECWTLLCSPDCRNVCSSFSKSNASESAEMSPFLGGVTSRGVDEALSGGTGGGGP